MINFGAIDYLCIVAKVALHIQRGDNSFVSRLRDTSNPSTQNEICEEGLVYSLRNLALLYDAVTIICLNRCAIAHAQRGTYPQIQKSAV